MTDDRRGPMPSFDFEFPEKKRKTRRRQLYEEVSFELKNKRALDPEDASYTLLLEAEIYQSELKLQSPVRSTGNDSDFTFSPIKQ